MGMMNPASAEKREQAAAWPMKWHKFLTWFFLFVLALGAVWNGVTLLIDGLFNLSGTADHLMVGAGAGRGMFLLFSLLNFGLTALLLYTRSRLAIYGKNGPLMLYLALWASPLLTLVFDLCFALALDGSLSMMLQAGRLPTLAGNLALALVLFLASRTYYKKRAQLFTEE